MLSNFVNHCPTASRTPSLLIDKGEVIGKNLVCSRQIFEASQSPTGVPSESPSEEPAVFWVSKTVSGFTTAEPTPLRRDVSSVM